MSTRVSNFTFPYFHLLIFPCVLKRMVLPLTLSRWRLISYRNQSIDLQRKSMDWFLYDIGLRRERVNKED